MYIIKKTNITDTFPDTASALKEKVNHGDGVTDRAISCVVQCYSFLDFLWSMSMTDGAFRFTPCFFVGDSVLSVDLLAYACFIL